MPYDAIIIGAGHNGLVTGIYLARAGWRTLVLERNATVGGAVRSGEVTAPGFVHDLYSMNQNLFTGSTAYQELKPDLQRHGLRYRVSDRPFANVFPDGRALRIHRGLEPTLASLRAHALGDADGFLELRQHYRAFQDAMAPLLEETLPSGAAALTTGRALPSLGPEHTARLLQVLLSSTREIGDAYFATPEMRVLFACWGLHLDFGPDVSGGAMFPLLETFGAVDEGMAVAEGGAGRMTQALAGVLRESGGELRTEAEVDAVLVGGGRATGVRLTTGEELVARQAVVANVSPGPLYGRLLRDVPLPDEVTRAVRRYRYGPATMMIHLALREPLRWAAGDDLARFAYVHVAPYVEDLARTYTQAVDGLLPDNPLLIVGQTSAVDPTRAPDGGAVIWLQVRTLPAQPRGDAAGEITGTAWDDIADAYADRVLDKLERYAPGARERIVGRHVISPADLERSNPNLVGGDSVAGSHHLRQNLMFRPLAGYADYDTPVPRLYNIGAGTWPGAGTNAASGYLAAQRLLDRGRRRSVIAAAGVAGAAAGLAALGMGVARLRRAT